MRAVRHPNWRLAERLVAQVLPGSSGLEPGRIAGLSPDSWTPFQVDDRDPAEVEAALLRYCDGVLSGPLVVVTAASYGAQVGPFFVATEDLPRLVADHFELFGDLFVSIDLVIVAPAAGRVVVVHHNGLITTLCGDIVRQ